MHFLMCQMIDKHIPDSVDIITPYPKKKMSYSVTTWDRRYEGTKSKAEKGIEWSILSFQRKTCPWGENCNLLID